MTTEPENANIEIPEAVEVMGEDGWWEAQIRRTPWWAISLGVHGLILFICWMVVLVVADEPKVVLLAWIPSSKPEVFDPDPRLPDGKIKPVEDMNLPAVDDLVLDRAYEPDVRNESADDDDHRMMKGDSMESLARKPLGGPGLSDIIGGGGGRAGSHGTPYSGRFNRRKVGGPGGGEPDRKVEAALRWLKRHQDEDGRWDADGFSKHCGTDMCQTAGMKNVDSGLTGLAVLAYLGAGHTSKSARYGDTVRRGLDWLCAIQKADGDLRLDGDMYCHAMASMALIEAYGMMDYKYKQAAQKAVDFIVEAQNPGAGWRYRPKGGDNDISVTGWQIMALKSAKMSKLNIPAGVTDGARKFVESTASGSYRGKFSYQSPEGASPRRTAIGMVCLMFMGDPAGDGRFDESAAYVNTELPKWDEPDFYKWYYAALALNLMQGPQWKSFNAAMMAALCPNQRKGGHADGSWDSEKDPYAREGRGGRVMATAVGALCLEVYYRYNLMQK
ncbi:MAG: prenyltransferase/squalene oxidase repeat-containing protein [Planctomycetota bacterium]